MGGAFDRSPLTDGMARVQIVQRSVDTPAVNVVATGTNANLATQLQSGRTSEYAEVPAGTLDVEVRLADTGEVLATVPGVALEAGKVHELILMGTPGDDDKPLEIRSLVTDAQERGAGTPAA
jgi:hypothetical protein